VWNGREWVYILPLNKLSQTLTRDVSKSQIAIEYAYRFRHSHPRSHVFWVYAADSASFVRDCYSIARRLQLPACDDPNTDVCELVSKWLNEEDSLWLMIVDNADNADLLFSSAELETQRPMIDYFPKRLQSQKLLLFTTRNRSVGQDLADGGRVVEVPPFSPQEAMELLQSKANSAVDSIDTHSAERLLEPAVEVPPFSSQEAMELLQSKANSAVESNDTHSAERLLDVLGYIPLAITQAVAFMNGNQMTIQSYLADLERNEQNPADYLSQELQDHRRQRGFPNSVFRAWELSFDQILAQEPKTAKLLSLLAMLAPQGIPQKLLRRSAEGDVNFKTAIGTLDAFALISREFGGETYAIHPLVQASVHYWLEQRSQKTDYASQALQLLAEEFPNGEHEHEEMCKSMLAHAQAVLCHTCTSENDMRHRAALLYNVGCFHWRQERYVSAYQAALESYDIYQEQTGDVATTTLSSLLLLALVLQCQGKYQASEEMGRRALKGSEKVLGVEHPDTLTSVSNLALVLQNQGKYKAAEELHRRSLEGSEKVLGAEHPDTLTSVSNLALVLQDQRKYKASEKMTRRALEGREQVLGVEHPVTLDSVYNLACLLHNQQRYHDASIFYRRAIAGLLKTFSPDHPTTQACSEDYASMISEMKGQGIGVEHSGPASENMGERHHVCPSLSIGNHCASNSSLEPPPRLFIGQSQCHCQFYSPFDQQLLKSLMLDRGGTSMTRKDG